MSQEKTTVAQNLEMIRQVMVEANMGFAQFYRFFYLSGALWLFSALGILGFTLYWVSQGLSLEVLQGFRQINIYFFYLFPCVAQVGLLLWAYRRWENRQDMSKKILNIWSVGFIVGICAMLFMMGGAGLRVNNVSLDGHITANVIPQGFLLALPLCVALLATGVLLGHKKLVTGAWVYLGGIMLLLNVSPALAGAYYLRWGQVGVWCLQPVMLLLVAGYLQRISRRSISWN